MDAATTTSATTGAIQWSRRRDGVAAEVTAVSTGIAAVVDVRASSAKLRSLADWNRCSGFFSKQRRTIRESIGEILGFVSLTSGGSTVKIEFMTSTTDSPENGRPPHSIS